MKTSVIIIVVSILAFLGILSAAEPGLNIPLIYQSSVL